MLVSELDKSPMISNVDIFTTTGSRLHGKRLTTLMNETILRITFLKLNGGRLG
jgi:hypothetical protein